MALRRTLLLALGLLLALPALLGQGPGHRLGPDLARRAGRAARPKLRAQAPRPSFDADDPSAPVLLPSTDDDDDDGGESIGRASGGASDFAARAFARPTDPAGSAGGSPRGSRRARGRPVPVHIRC